MIDCEWGFFYFSLSFFRYQHLSIWEKKKQPFRTFTIPSSGNGRCLHFSNTKAHALATRVVGIPALWRRRAGYFIHSLRRTVALAALLDRANEL